MRNKKHDIIVLGSGLAGLRAAIEAAHNPEVDVAIIAKAQLMGCEEAGSCLWLLRAYFYYESRLLDPVVLHRHSFSAE